MAASKFAKSSRTSSRNLDSFSSRDGASSEISLEMEEGRRGEEEPRSFLEMR
jgi:hypothetical protein